MLGDQVQINPDNAVKASVARTGIVKTIGQPDLLRSAKRTAIKIYRGQIAQRDQQYVPDDTPDLRHIYQQGRDYVDRMRAELGGWNNERLFLEGWNEPLGQDGGPEWPKLVAWTRGFTDRAHELGYKVLGFCFATGNPPSWVIRWLAEHDWLGIDALGYHGYWGTQGFTVWNARRYVNFWEESGHYMPPVIVVEGGIDAIEGGRRGWKLLVNSTTFRAQLVDYRGHLRTDRAAGIPIIGAAPFVLAPVESVHQEDDWTDFDLEEFLDVLSEDWEPEWELVEKWLRRNEGVPEHEYRYGFRELADQLGRTVVGEPITDEDYDGHGDSRQYTTRGMMLWSKAANVCQFYAAVQKNA